MRLWCGNIDIKIDYFINSLKYNFQSRKKSQVILPQNMNLWKPFGCLPFWERVVCMCAKLLQVCLSLCNPMDCSPPGSSLQGIIQARILEWVAISFPRESSQLKDQAHISLQLLHCRWMLYDWATWEAPLERISDHKKKLVFHKRIIYSHLHNNK